jgi:uncharacterized repeat protein (TIGR01451 family)
MTLFAWKKRRNQTIGHGRKGPYKPKQSGRRPILERLEDRTVPSVSLGTHFTGVTFSASSCGCEPPDTNAAAGPNNVVEVVNTALQITDKSGNVQSGPTSFSSFFSGHGFTVNNLSDPVVLFDESVVNSSGPNGRFVVLILDFDNNLDPNFLDIAVSQDADATHNFTNFRQIAVGETNFFADQPRLGINADAYFVEMNMFAEPGPGAYDHAQVLTIQKSDFLTGGLTTFHHDIAGGTSFFSVDPANMHGASSGGPEYFVGEAPTAGQISVFTETNVLSNTPMDAETDLTVPSYTTPNPAPQPNGSMATNDSRMLNAVWRDNVLVADQNVGAGATAISHARWYQFDTSGSTPTLNQSGEIDPGNGIATYFPSIDIDVNGNFGMTFMESSSTEFVSMYVTGRAPNDPTGTMETPVKALSGNATYMGGRAGDYSGTSVDPSTGTSFWSANEFVTSSDIWSTGVATFALTADLAASVSAVANANEGDNLTYNVTITNNGPADAANLVLTDTLPANTTFVSADFPGGVVNSVTNGMFTVTYGGLAASATLTGTVVVTATEEGSDVNRVKITSDTPDPNLSNNMGMATIAVADQSVAATGASLSGAQNMAQDFVVATFTDPGGAEALTDYSATIQWGDGSTSPGTITFLSGTFSVDATHTYTTSGTKNVTVKIHHDTAGDVTAMTTILVVSTAPTDVALGLSAPPTANEGDKVFYQFTLTNNGSADASNVVLTDPLPANTTFDMADSSFPDGSFSFNGGVVTVTDTLLPAMGSVSGQLVLIVTEEGSLTNSMSITTANPDTDPTNDNASAMTTVSDVSVVPMGQTVTVTEGTPSGDLVVATFTDPGSPEPLSDYSATIDWGDGSATTAGTITFDATTNTFSVHGSHTYAEEGPETTTVTVSHDLTADASTSGTVTVDDSGVTPTGGFAFQASEGTPSALQTIATFTDPAGAEVLGDYSAKIIWGDGTSSLGAITFDSSNNVFTVQGNHLYVDEGASGSFIIATVVSHDTAPNASAISRATVVDPSVSAMGGFSFSGGEGSDTGVVTVATFTDPAGAEAGSNYSASIAWGDGTTSPGTIGFNSGTSTFTVTGQHSYVEEGSLTATVTIHHGLAADVMVTDSAQISDPQVAASGLPTPIAAPESTAADLVVATFADPGGPEALADYSASIDWGDGSTPSSATITFDAALKIFSVHGAHAYGEEGPSFVVTVTIQHDQTAPVTVTSTVHVVDVSVAGTGNFIVSAAENADSGAQTVATFVDPAGAEAIGDYSASIDWGDGSLAGTGAITLDSSTGTFTVQGSHLYAEEGIYTIQVTLGHDTAANVTVFSRAVVAEIPVAASPTPAVTGVEGADTGTVTVAKFTDPGGAEALSEYVAVIAWGDNSTSFGTITFDSVSGVFSVSGNHTYAMEGMFRVVVNIQHGSGFFVTTSSITNSALISDTAVVAMGTSSSTAMEGVPSGDLVVATFADPAGAELTPDLTAHYSASIDWGDGTSSIGTITVDTMSGVFSVHGSHTFATNGTATVTVTVNHDLASPATTTGTVQVSDVSVIATGGFNVTGAEGQDTGTQTVATFTDPGGSEPVANYSADIDWGDGTPTSAGTISFAGGTFTVMGSHSYAEESQPGFPYGVTVTIHHGTAADAMALSTADVADVAVNATAGSFTGIEGVDTGTVVVATFTDPGGAEVLGDYSATIDWGDSGSAPANIAFDSGTGIFTVTAGHGYTEEGTYTTTVTISHDTAPDAVVHGTAQVSDQAVMATGNFNLTAVEGTTSDVQTLATFTDPAGMGPQETMADYTATVTWGDGSSSPGSISFDSSTNTFTVAGSHLYSEEGSYSPSVLIHHGSAADQTVMDSVVVSDPSVSATGGITIQTTEGTASGEGTSISNAAVATFTDSAGPEAIANYSASIDWGDGTTSPGSIAFDPVMSVFTVLGSHSYVEEGTYTIATLISHELTGQVQVTSTAVVSDVSVAAVGGFSFAATEGIASTAQTVATFQDPAGAEVLGDYNATIAWGDGTTSTAGQISLAGGVFTVAGSHLYTDEGQFTITVTIHHDMAADRTITSTATVADQPPIAQGGISASAVEGVSPATLTLATFTDPAGAEPVTGYSAQINWGDGTTTAGGIARISGSSPVAFRVSGTHAYIEEGNYSITVTVLDGSTAAQPVSSSVSVGDAALNMHPGALQAVEGTAVSTGIIAFTDSSAFGTASDFTAAINWGDGTSSPGTVTQAGAAFVVSGTHTYASVGVFPATVTVTDIGGSQAQASTRITVTDPPISAAAIALSGFERTALTNTAVATFIHANGVEPASNFTATIFWGDGTSSAGTVAQTSTNYTVLGTHNYEEEGTYPIQVNIDGDQAIAAVQTTATMLEELLPDGTRGTATQRWLSETYRELLGRKIDSSGLVGWTAALANGTTRTQVVLAIEASAEYRQNVINNFYVTLLGRAATPMELGIQLRFLTTPVHGALPTFEQLEAMILGSPEYFQKHGANNTSFLNAVYQDVLGRPIEQGALSDRLSQLSGGVSRAAEALDILMQGEAAGDRVEAAYQKYLGRLAEPAALSNAENALLNGMRDELLIANIIASDEYFSRTIQ